MLANHPALQGDPVRITVDEENCIECDKCFQVCPLTQFIGFKSIQDPFARYLCIECGACSAVCPKDAIRVSDIGLGTPIGKLPPSDEALNLIKTRRTIRSFKEQKVKREDWDKLLEAVKYAPTGHNAQYIDVIIIESPEILNEISAIGMEIVKKFAGLLNKPILRTVYKRMMGDHAYTVFAKTALFYEQQEALVERGADPILFHAPALMLFLAPKFGTMSQNEADLAAQTVAIYAPTLGLGTCYSGIVMVAFNGLSKSITRLVPVPPGYKVFNALIVGYTKTHHRYIPYRKARNVYFL